MYRQKWFTAHVKPEHAIMRHTVVIMMFLRFLLLSCLYFRYSDGMFGVYICVRSCFLSSLFFVRLCLQVADSSLQTVVCIYCIGSRLSEFKLRIEPEIVGIQQVCQYGHLI